MTVGLGDLSNTGAIAQLGEHLPCTQGVSGSIPLSSTNSITFRYLIDTSDNKTLMLIQGSLRDLIELVYF